MSVAVTLSRYIARQFVLSVLAMIASLTGVVCLFDFIDLVRRVATRPNVSTNIVTEIAGLHIPRSEERRVGQACRNGGSPLH